MSEMYIEVDERTLGMWHISPSPTYNWLAHLAKGEGEYVVTWRIRVYTNREIFDSQDEFRWHQNVMQGVTEEVALEKARLIWRMACQHAPTDGAWELLRGHLTLAQFQRKLIKMPDMHVDPQPNWRPGIPIGVT